MENESSEPSTAVNWATKIKARFKEVAIALGGVALVIPVAGQILDEGKSVICRHFIDCATKEAPEKLASAANVAPSLVDEERILSYNSDLLGLSFQYPINLLSLDNTDRQSGRLYLLDRDGERTVVISRLPGKPSGSVIEIRSQEADEIRSNGSTVTYLAPEMEKNISNWYVISGLRKGSVFYIRRHFIAGEVISYEVNFPKDRQSQFVPFIDLLRDEFKISSINAPEGN